MTYGILGGIFGFGRDVKLNIVEMADAMMSLDEDRKEI